MLRLGVCFKDYSVELASRIRNEEKVTVPWVTSLWTFIWDLLLHSAVSQRPWLGWFQWYYWCITDVSFILLCLLIRCKWVCIRGIFFKLSFEFWVTWLSACTLSRWSCGTCMGPPHNPFFMIVMNFGKALCMVFFPPLGFSLFFFVPSPNPLTMLNLVKLLHFNFRVCHVSPLWQTVVIMWN